MAGLCLLWIAATCSKAICSNGGNDLFLLAARRKIPAQALALKKYRDGRLPVSSTSDNEDATAALGHSEELSVQNPVRDPIPEFHQRAEHGSKRPPSVNRQDTGDVFPDEPPGSNSRSKPEILQREVATRIIQSEPLSGDGERLTGCASNENVNWTGIAGDFREVAKVSHLRKAVREHRAREGIGFRKPGWPPAQTVPCNAGGLDARAH